MEIRIIKNNIYDYALALTTRAGSASVEYNQQAITKDNYPMLEVYLSEAITQAESAIRKKLANSHAVDMRLKGDVVTIETKEQHQADVSVYPLIESSIRLYAAYYIAASWLQPTAAAALAEAYGATAATHLQTAVSAFSQKDRARVTEADYGNRTTDRISSACDAYSIADYGARSEDDRIVRPGIRLVETEVLVVRADEDSEEMLPAVSSEGAYLTTNA